MKDQNICIKKLYFNLKLINKLLVNRVRLNLYFFVVFFRFFLTISQHYQTLLFQTCIHLL